MSGDVFVSFKADTGPLEASFATARAEVRGLQSELNRTAAEMRSTGAAADSELGQHFKALSVALSEAKGHFAEVNEQLRAHKVVAEEAAISLASLQEYAKRGLELAGISLTVDAIKEWIASTTEAAEHTERLSAQLGASTTEIQEIGGAAKLTGTDVDAMAVQLERLQLGLAKSASATAPARAGLRALGIDAEQFKQLSIPQQFEELAEAVSHFADGATKTAAVQALGRSFVEMLPLLDKGKDGFRELEDEVRAAGGVLSSQMVASLAHTREDLSLLGIAIGGASARFLTFINGPLDAAINGLTRLIAAANPGALASGIKDLADKAIDEANAVVGFAIETEGAWKGLVATILAGADDIVGSLNRVLEKTQEAGVASRSALNSAAAAALASADPTGAEGLRQKRNLFDTLNPTGGAGLPSLDSYVQEQANELARLKARLDAAKDAADAAHAAVARVLGGGGGDLHDRNLGALPAQQKPQVPEPQIGGRGGSGGADSGAEDADGAREAFQNQVDEARRAAQATIDSLNDEVRQHKISWDIWAADSRAALREEAEAITAAGVAAVNNDALTADQKLRIARETADKIAELDKEEAADATRAAEETQKAWENFFKPFNSALESQISAVISGHETMRQAVTKTLDSMLADLTKFFVTWTLKQAELVLAHIAGNQIIEASDATTALGSLGPMLAAAGRMISIDAGVVAGGVAANQAFIAGPGAVAEGLGAAAVVAGFAGGIGSADIGMWEVPKDQLSLIHQSELVMPAAEAGAFRELLTGAARGGGQGGGGSVAIHPTTNFQVNALDGASVASWMRSNGPGMAKAIDEAVRHGAAVGLKRLRG
jgi:hypothetical protein